MNSRFSSLALMCASLSLVSTAMAAPATPAQRALAKPVAPVLQHRPALPSTRAERLALWESLSPVEQQRYVERFLKEVGPGVHQAIEAQRRVQRDARPARGTSAMRLEVALHEGRPATRVPTGDDDGDGLDQELERQLAEGLALVYHVSTGEVATTGFATLQDTPALSAGQFLGQRPAAVHYRVSPLGQAIFQGVPFTFLQVDYLTVWNRDDGLPVGGFCRTNAAILGGLIGLGLAEALDGSAAHDWDVERTAVLLGAPTASAADASAYRAYEYYLAGHEGTFLLDQSRYILPSFPWGIGNHAAVGLSRAKHATYPFNPDYHPLVWPEVINATYWLIDDLYWNYVIDDWQYLIYLSIADTVFFTCLVERFGEQGGELPTFMLNIGENGLPLNGSGWIADPRVASKLQPLW